MEQRIRFVDLKTGNTFDGSHPYIFWLDGGQSTNIIYTHPICFISNNREEKVYLEENEVFNLVDITKLEEPVISTLHDFEYHDINDLKVKPVNEEYIMTSVGAKHHNYYVHMIYILASALAEGEYIADFKIGDEVFKIGGDFYGVDETLYVNLLNNGVSIPPSVQKALYDANPHEERPDNITLNRKFKELLSNFWDVIANKGSYKSLLNSLKWFEWGDNIQICEVWKNVDTQRYFVKDLQMLLADKYFATLNGYAKTTYLALYHALEKPNIVNGIMQLDNEKNPVLQRVVSKWSIRDLALKLCLLGSYYEKYFMPIHLDLIHSTIEDVVYTNTFKIKTGSIANRLDQVLYCEDINCNVKNGDSFGLGLVQCYVCPETLFGSTYEDNKGVTIIGVQKTSATSLNDSEGELRDYMAQLYNEIGAVVDFKITISDPDIQIKREVLVFKTFSNGNWVNKTITEYKILGNEIEFSLFCPIEGEYDVRLQLDSTDGRSYTKRVKFNIKDYGQTKLNIYRIRNLGSLYDCKIGQANQLNNYLNTRRSDGVPIMQYIPSKIINPIAYDENNKIIWEHKGICLNHLLIYNDWNNDTIESLKQNYFLLKRPIKNNEGTISKTYLICVSKQYGFQPDPLQVPQDGIYRNDYIFVPEFHTLVPLVENERNINDYKVTEADALCVVPEIPYGKSIDECDWEFINTTKQTKVSLGPVKEPFIANTEKSPLEPGYYSIVFRYRLTGEEKINTITIDSAFIKV